MRRRLFALVAALAMAACISTSPHESTAPSDRLAVLEAKVDGIATRVEALDKVDDASRIEELDRRLRLAVEHAVLMKRIADLECALQVAIHQNQDARTLPSRATREETREAVRKAIEALGGRVIEEGR